MEWIRVRSYQKEFVEVVRLTEKMVVFPNGRKALRVNADYSESYHPDMESAIEFEKMVASEEIERLEAQIKRVKLNLKRDIKEIQSLHE